MVRAFCCDCYIAQPERGLESNSSRISIELHAREAAQGNLITNSSLPPQRTAGFGSHLGYTFSILKILSRKLWRFCEKRPFSRATGDVESSHFFSKKRGGDQRQCRGVANQGNLECEMEAILVTTFLHSTTEQADNRQPAQRLL
jgi:hypothetical protein